MRADKKKVEKLLKTARGQIDGILKMVEDDRYCIDISNQLLAVQAMLRKTNNEVLKAHIHGCVLHSIENGNPEEKLDEIMSIVEKISK